MRYFLSIFMAIMLVIHMPVFASTSAALNPAQTAQVQQIVKQYLLDNPQILLEMGQKLQQQQVAQAQQAAAQAKKALPTLAGVLLQSPGSPVVGNTKGQVTLVEFFDYQCSHCRDMASIVSNLMQQNANLRVVYKELPIFGGNSALAARAALAARIQGKYQAMHNALMQSPLPLTQQSILAIASAQGLNVKQLQTDMDSPAVARELKQNDTLATQLHLQGTPAFVVSPTNSQDTNQATLVPGATTAATLQQLITQMQG